MKVVRRGRRPRRSPYSRYGWQAAGALASYGLSKAGRYIDNKVNSYVDRKSKSSEMAPLTAEKDVRMTYRKRRMPRRKRRRYVKQLRRWQSNMLRSEPSRIHFLVDARAYESAVNCSRYFGCFMGLMSQNVYDTSLGNVWDQVTNFGQNAAKFRHASLRIDHMGLNVVLRNVLQSPGLIGLCDIDVYKVVCIRDIPADRWTDGLPIESMHAGLKAELRQQIGMDHPVSDAGGAIGTTQTNAGTSSSNQAVYDVLFNNPPFLRYWKVIRCWKIQLGVGQTVTFNWRDSRNKRVKRDECITGDGASLAAKKGVTKGYIFNINGRWDGADTSPQFEPVKVVCEHSVRYNYKPVVPLSSDTLVYDGV